MTRHIDIIGIAPEREDGILSRYTYESYDDAIADIIRFKDQSWCSHCDRAFFFQQVCGVHVDVDALADNGSDDSAASDIMFWEVVPDAVLVAV
jgi:hypothetical protein